MASVLPHTLELSPLDQLVRECPPGFGGIERVAHTIASQQNGVVYFCRPSNTASSFISINYSRSLLPCFFWGKFLFPLPSLSFFRLLFKNRPLIVHLPCPSLFLFASLAKFLNPRRRIYLYWHAFLVPDSSFYGFLVFIYQFISLRLISIFSVVTTSPVLRDSLISAGLRASRISILPCVLPSEFESLSLSIPRCSSSLTSGVIIFIGRLDSYKRIDLLIDLFIQSKYASVLHVVGSGPDENALQELCSNLTLPAKRIILHGCLEELQKCILISSSDLLLLPSDKCNEAFGIVQLEAMACGIPSLSRCIENSGMFWVSNLPCYNWDGNFDTVLTLMDHLLSSPSLYSLASSQAFSRYNSIFSRKIWHNNFLKCFY